MPRDLSLTIDQRLQDFAAAELGGDAGAVVALDPNTGAVLALVSTPTFDATAISGDPATAREAMDALRNDPAEPLLGRARQGLYVPGSIMKVFTGSSGLDAGVITPSTTFPDQPAQEIDGFPVDGFPIREHDLGGIRPDLWAPVRGAPGVEQHLLRPRRPRARRRSSSSSTPAASASASPMAIGPSGRALGVAPSYVTAPVDRDCGPFADNAELASAAFGQGLVQVTPVQMAMVAAAIAGDGVMPQPWVVGDVRTHAEGTTMSDSVLQTFGSLGGTRVVGSEAASQMRVAMVDAVNGDLGRLFAGQGDIRLYGIGDHLAAGKTGTAELGGEQAPHSWFIGFAPAENGATPSIAIAVLVESGGSGSGRAAPIAGRVWRSTSAWPARG